MHLVTLSFPLCCLYTSHGRLGSGKFGRQIRILSFLLCNFESFLDSLCGALSFLEKLHLKKIFKWILSNMHKCQEVSKQNLALSCNDQHYSLRVSVVLCCSMLVNVYHSMFFFFFCFVSVSIMHECNIQSIKVLHICS